MFPSNPSDPFSCLETGTNSNNKRKRRPAGTPDPDAEVVSLSPKTLMESDRYVCEICNQGFQRDQNLQMHRRRHKVPWKLLKRETPSVRKRVFVCPEPSCLHHDPCHALGDLVGIKKHFRRKHSNHKQWVCHKCSKAYAVQSDFKAHLKTCGTRGHSCDCGRVFSRVESFIEHQDACNMGRVRPETQPKQQPPETPCLSRSTSSTPTPSSDTNFSTTPAGNGSTMVVPTNPAITDSMFLISKEDNHSKNKYNLELQLSTTTSNPLDRVSAVSSKIYDNHSTHLQLSIGSCEFLGGNQRNEYSSCEKPASRELKDEAREQLRLAMAEKAYAEQARQEAKKQIELAEQEFASAKKIRQRAQAELNKAQALKDHAIKKINSNILQITCQSCKRHFQATNPFTHHNSLVSMSYFSPAILSQSELEITACRHQINLHQN